MLASPVCFWQNEKESQNANDNDYGVRSSRRFMGYESEQDRRRKKKKAKSSLVIKDRRTPRELAIANWCPGARDYSTLIITIQRRTSTTFSLFLSHDMFFLWLASFFYFKFLFSLTLCSYLCGNSRRDLDPCTYTRVIPFSVLKICLSVVLQTNEIVSHEIDIIINKIWKTKKCSEMFGTSLSISQSQMIYLCTGWFFNQTFLFRIVEEMIDTVNLIYFFGTSIRYERRFMLSIIVLE